MLTLSVHAESRTEVLATAMLSSEVHVRNTKLQPFAAKIIQKIGGQVVQHGPTLSQPLEKLCKNVAVFVKLMDDLAVVRLWMRVNLQCTDLFTLRYIPT